jgi:poly(3-hydroxybutyrate) depolymerase
MAEISRRTFLTRSAAVAAGAAAVAAAGIPEVARAAARPASDTDAAADSGDTVVAYVRAGGGDVTLMVGEREVVANDRELARRIRRAAR